MPNYLDSDSDNDGIPDRMETVSNVLKRATKAETEMFTFCLSPYAGPHGKWSMHVSGVEWSGVELT